MDTELVLVVLQAIAALAAFAVALWAGIQSYQTGKVIETTRDLLEDFNIAFGVKAGMEGGLPYIISLEAAYQLNDMVEDGTITEEQAEQLRIKLLAYADQYDKEKMRRALLEEEN